MKRFLYFDTYITGVAPSLTADRMLLAALFCAWGLSDQRMKVHACQEQAEYSVCLTCRVCSDVSFTRTMYSATRKQKI